MKESQTDEASFVFTQKTRKDTDANFIFLCIMTDIGFESEA